MRTGDVLISVGTGSRPSGQPDEARVTLRIEERISGEPLVAVEMTAAEWWTLIIGAARWHEGRVIDPSAVDRLGKEMRTEKIPVPDSGYTVPHEQRDPDHRVEGKHQERRAQEWAEAHWGDVPEPKAVRTMRTNQGMRAILHTWHEVES